MTQTLKAKSRHQSHCLVRAWVDMRTSPAIVDPAGTRKKKPSPGRERVFGIKPLAVTYSCMDKPHYHRRGCVSLPSSGWDRVGPQRYGRQGRG
jgi:hypothetical protein